MPRLFMTSRKWNSKRPATGFCVRFFLCFFLLCASLVSFGKVYLLSPSKSSSQGKSPSFYIDAGRILSEPVVINGVSATLDVSIASEDFRTILARLKYLPKEARVYRDKNSVLIQEMLPDGRISRTFIVDVGGVMPVLVFSIELPKQLPRNFIWPRDQIPSPHDSESIRYVLLPNRKTAYGEFFIPPNVADIFSEFSATLSAEGWKELGDSSRRGRGGVFVNSDGDFMTVQFGESTNEKGRGAVYLKRK